MSWKVSKLLTLAWVLAAGISAAQAPCPLWPGQPGWLEDQIRRREVSVAEARERSISLIEKFLQDFPQAAERAQALFRLAELYWEKAQADYLARMQQYDQLLEEHRAGRLAERPAEPRLDLSQSLRVYEEILEKHPDFEKSDMVLYLYGFGLNEQGEEDSAVSIYRTLIAKYPQSAFVADAHLALGEYDFSKGHYEEALASYRQVLRRPGHPLQALAEYKTAWCLFKLGKAKQAAKHFRQVLATAQSARQQMRKKGEVDAAALEKEALEDLALTFSESGGAKAALAFMSQVGGDDYSLEVLDQLGRVFLRQARYPNAIESFQLILDKFPGHRRAPEVYQQLIAAFAGDNQQQRALELQRRMVENYGPTSPWAEQNRNDNKLIEEALSACEENSRQAAKTYHQQAQKKKDQTLYQKAEEAYLQYLKHFPDHPRAGEMRFLLAEVQYARGNFLAAAENYLAASDRLETLSQRVDAAWASALAYAKLFPPPDPNRVPPAQAEDTSAAEKGFLQAADQFAELAPDDERAPRLQAEAGRLLYFKGQFAQASGRLLQAAGKTKNPEEAEAAADLALDCFTRSADWVGLEKNARQLHKLELLKNTKLGAKLPEIAAGAIFQQAMALKNQNETEKAVAQFRRLAAEFSSSPLAPSALVSAAATLEGAGRRDRARDIYLEILQKYPEQAADAVAALARLLEQKFDYRHAAEAWRDLARRYPDDRRAADALLKAAMLFSSVSDHRPEIEALEEFGRRWPEHPRAEAVLLAAAQAKQKAGQWTQAEETFGRYLKKYGRKFDRNTRTAWLNLGKVQLKLGKSSAARESFERCSAPLKKQKISPEENELLAECLFNLGELVVEQYQKIGLQPPQSRLIADLKKKAQLLKNAEGLFAQVVATSSLEWASAALYRIGDMYAQFARAIYDAPLPSGLSEKESEIYREQLQSLAFPIEEKARQALEVSFQMALKHGYHSRWTVSTLERLQELDPGRYPKLQELRPAAGWADSYTSAPLILEPAQKLEKEK